MVFSPCGPRDAEETLQARPYSDTAPAAPTSSVPQHVPAVTDRGSNSDRPPPPSGTAPRHGPVTDWVNAQAPSTPGCWASTKRYVRELGKSTRENPFAAIGTVLLVLDLGTRGEAIGKAVQTAFATNPPDNIDKTQLFRCRLGSAGVNDTMVDNFPDGTTVCCPVHLHLQLSCPDDDDNDGANNSTASGANATVWVPSDDPSIFAAASTFDKVGGVSLQQPLPTDCSAMSVDINLINVLDAVKGDGCDVCGDDD